VGAAAGLARWRAVLLWSGPADNFLSRRGLRFKFVTGQHRWLEVPASAPNAVRDDSGNINRGSIRSARASTCFRFTLAAPLELSKPWRVEWTQGRGEGAALRPDGIFFELRSELPLRCHRGEKEDGLPPLRAAGEPRGGMRVCHVGSANNSSPVPAHPPG